MKQKHFNIFKNKKILITGGTGSFGSTFLQELSKTKFNKIIVLSRDEEKQHTLRIKYKKFKNIIFIIGDVRDKSSIIKWFNKVDIVIHTAALKQVPSCEYHPSEAFKTNVLGTENVMNCSIENKVKKFIFLSTDKSVYPINAMGITKALAEKIIISKSRELTKKNDTKLIILRYGNVIASRGSVVRTFIEQIKNKIPLTITSVNMTRFIMSLNNAIELLCNALKFAKQGEIFIQKAKAINLKDLVISLKKIFNYTGNINVIGVRHGEKLYESLLTEEESRNIISKKNIIVVKPDNRNLNYEIYFNKGNEKKMTYIGGYRSDKVKLTPIKELIKILKKENFINENINK